MPEDISVNKELGIIEVQSYGEVTYEDTLSSLATLEESMGQSGITKVLADTRNQEFRPSTAHVYDFGARLPRDAKIAVIVSQEQPTGQDVSFLCDVAQNHGVDVSLFWSRSEALDWLKN